MFWTILDEQRRSILPALGVLRSEGFHLAGGTALALQIGHRDSVDFDFFTPDPFETGKLFDILSDTFTGMPLVKVQDERNTLSVVAGESIKLSCMRYPYPLLEPLIQTEYLQIADIADIGCMKLSAITGRGTMKDYVDLYFILFRIPIEELLASCALKLPQLDRALILKALVYFDDLEDEPILYSSKHETSFEEVKRFLRAQAKRVF
ncbi:MAG: nucleotidyl transferase AbiEii/AbiGii toxin family protein [Flavobacteriales bacterium]|nr:nucleotidyl transferase AbiEii/AbiGii toxin family protein [Flavobacteriales bacterium]